MRDATRVWPAIEFHEPPRNTWGELRELSSMPAGSRSATEVYGVIEAVLVDEIRPAIEYLEAASRVTVDELRERPGCRR